MENIKLTEHDLAVGSPLPWPIYDSSGRVLLRAGQPIVSEKNVRALITAGACRKPTEEEIADWERGLKREKGSLLERLELLKENNHDLLVAIYRGESENAEEKLELLVDDVGSVCRENADLVLGALLLDRKSPYTVVHPIMTAVICQIMEGRVGFSNQEKHAMTKAALAANVGMLELMEELAEQEEVLTDEQRKQIESHPEKSCQLLKQAGVNDELCLEIIMMHHEKIDGSGYPQGLSKDGIPETAKLLALADIYSAMLLPRRYRTGLHAKKALQYVFSKRGRKLGEDLVESFIKEIGIYPPGVFVKLENGETGIVIKRSQENADKPVVSVIYANNGFRHNMPKIRHTNENNVFSISEIIAPQQDEELDFDMLTIWSGTKDHDGKLNSAQM